MEISKKDIKCKGITNQIERLTSAVRQFIRLVNCSIPKGLKLNKENIFIWREDENSYLDDGNTKCEGYSYRIFWSYTPANVKITKEAVINLLQQKAVTFVLECSERCYDHKKDKGQFFTLYYKSDNSGKPAERVDYINDNDDVNYLFKPDELMQIVWQVKNSYGLYPKNISENDATFERFAKNFENEDIRMKIDHTSASFSEELSKEVFEGIKEFELAANRFATIVNCYCAVSSGKVTIEDLKKFLNEGECSAVLEKAMSDFCSNEVFDPMGKDVYPQTFLWQRDKHYTLHTNERLNTFTLFDCIKSIIGYTYFNDYVYLRGISENWYPRLLYFSYYISKDQDERYYTITMAGCEKRFRKNNLQVIQAETLEDLFSAQNAIKVAKWLEEIWEKTRLINYYSSLIKKNEVRNFSRSREID